MVVEMLIHLEAADGAAVWWAEVPELPGFSAAADTLAELRAQARAAIDEIVRDQGQVVGAVAERLAGVVPEEQNVSPAAGFVPRRDAIVALVGV